MARTSGVSGIALRSPSRTTAWLDREDRVAELPARMTRGVGVPVEVRAERDVHVQLPGQPFRLVDEAAVGVEVPGDLLKAGHVDGGGTDDAGGAGQIQAAVDAGTVRDVEGHDAQRPHRCTVSHAHPR